jgi:hypothetical protein
MLSKRLHRRGRAWRAQSQEIFELQPLERRVLLSGTLISGPSSTDVDVPYVLNLNVLPQGAGPQWTIDWGDGTSPSTPNGNASSAMHEYQSGPASLTIAATIDSLPNPLDATFGIDGRVKTDLGTADDYPLDVVVQSADGNIVVAGAPNFSVARYNTDGSLDTTFGGGDGWVTESGTDKGTRSLCGLTENPDGTGPIIAHHRIGPVPLFFPGAPTATPLATVELPATARPAVTSWRAVTTPRPSWAFRAATAERKSDAHRLH